MTPYRVLVEDDNGDETILVSMLSKDRTTGVRRIFIAEKPLPKLYTPTYEEKRHIAHQMTCRNNSSIEAKYILMKNDEGTRYQVTDPDGRRLPLDYYIQSDCLIAALRDYLAYSNHSLHIVDVL